MNAGAIIKTGLAISALLLTMGAEGGCEPAGKGTDISAETEYERELGAACVKAPRARGVRGVVVEDVSLVPGGPYCLQIRKAGYEVEDPDDDSGLVLVQVTRKAQKRCGWNDIWPACASRS